MHKEHSLTAKGTKRPDLNQQSQKERDKHWMHMLFLVFNHFQK